MSFAALPYAVLLLLVESAAGLVGVSMYVSLRPDVPRGLPRLGAWTALFVVLGAVWMAAAVAWPTSVDTYVLSTRWVGPLRGALVAAAVLTFGWLVSLYGGWAARRLLGGAAAAAAAAAMVFVSAVVAGPTWGYAGALLSLLAGAASVGAATLAMSQGHWYLTNAHLPARPLRELTMLLVGALVLEIAVMALNLMLPARHVPTPQDALVTGLSSNPAFYLRVGVGLLFPLVLAYLAWRSAGERAMMSATGLLYIALGAVLAGEVLARGLLFVTAVAV